MSDEESGGSQLSSEQFNKLLAAINEARNETKQLRKEIVTENNKLKTEFQQELVKLKEEIKLANVHHSQEIDKQNKTIKDLNNKCLELQQRCLKLDRNLRKNNLIIFGLKTPQNNLLDYVVNQIKSLLDISIDESEINNVYILKVANGNPTRIEFRNSQIKELLFKSAYKLKGSGVTITQDLCFEDRQDKKIITKYYKKAKSQNQKTKIKGNTLIINGEEWTVERLKQIDPDINNEHEDLEEPEKVNNLPVTTATGQELPVNNGLIADSEEITTQKEIGNTKKGAAHIKSNSTVLINERITRQKQNKK